VSVTPHAREKSLYKSTNEPNNFKSKKYYHISLKGNSALKPIRQIRLANGLTLLFHDRSRRYFGDYHRAKVEITCSIPILEEYFSEKQELEDAVKNLGDAVIFRRSVERMGVSSADLASVLASIMDNFCEHSIHYISSPAFPRKMVHMELAKARKTVKRRYPA
jgi:hypothetical protein